MRGICPKCKEFKKLTAHSKIGGHQKPFVYICDDCHKKEHNIGQRKTKRNTKIQRGTKDRRRKQKHLNS